MAQDRYIVIQEWMRALDLNASELLAFALIWGFCQDGESDYHGSVAYVADWCKVSERQARAILRKLTDAGLVTMTENIGKTNHYKVTPEVFAGGKLFPPTPEVFSAPTPEVFSADNKCSDNKEIIKDTCPSPRTREDMNSYGEYVRMTAANYSRLVSRFGADDAVRLCEILDSYLAKKPNVYRDHYRAALGWPVQRLQEEKLNQQRLKNAQEAGQRVNGQQTVSTNISAESLARIRRFEEKLERERNGLL